MRYSISACILIGAAFAQPVAAQQIPPLKLTVEALGPEAAACGVDEAGLEATARSAARYNKITLSDSAANFLYVNVNIVSAGSTCLSNISVDITGYSSVLFGGIAKFAKVVFCHAGAVGSTTKISGSRDILETLRQGVDRCLAKL